MRPYSPGGVLNALAATPMAEPPTSSTHRLRRGLPGYLILFAPHAFAHQRQIRTRESPSPLVFFPISTNFTSTLGIPSPLPSSSNVSSAVPRLSPGLSHLTRIAAYVPFTPSNSEQRLPPPYYRGCWHGVSRGLLLRLPSSSSPLKELYNPKAFFTHAAWLHQACAHCAIFPTAASRRSLGRVSVPVWLIILSNQLRIVALVSRYLTNKLIRRRYIQER